MNREEYPENFRLQIVIALRLVAARKADLPVLRLIEQLVSKGNR